MLNGKRCAYAVTAPPTEPEHFFAIPWETLGSTASRSPPAPQPSEQSGSPLNHRTGNRSVGMSIGPPLQRNRDKNAVMNEGFDMSPEASGERRQRDHYPDLDVPL